MKKRVLGIRSHIKLHKYLRVTGISASILLALFAVLTFNPVSHHEEEVEATANPSTSRLEILSDSNVAGVKLNVNSTNGTFAKTNSADEMKFSVITDNLTGYTLSLSATDDSGKLMNETINAAALDSITTALSYADFANGSSASAYNGMWGVEPSKYNSADNTDYLPAPTTEPMILDTTNKANTTANEYTVGIGARADFNTPSGVYSNTFVLQVVGRPVMYAINYLDTTEDDTVADLPEADSSSTATAVDFSLDEGSPTRDGYTFIGWCDGTVDHTNSPSTCDGNTYMPGAKYTFENSEETVNIANFYAMWKEKGYTITFNPVSGAESIELDGNIYTSGQTAELDPGVYSIKGHYNSRYTFSAWYTTTGAVSNTNYVDYGLNTYEVVGDATITLVGRSVYTAIQSMDASSCSSYPTPVYDNRDDQIYWVKKLDDGNCWMMDNLNLGAAELTTDLTSDNTNLTDTIAASTFNSWKKESGSRDYSSAEFIPVTPDNSITGSDIDPISGTKYGVLYNYCSLSAGTICTDSNNNNATSDLCPAGWRLPTGDEGGEFDNLYNNASYNTYDKMRAPISENGAAFALSGSFFGDSIQYQGNFANYWSSSKYNNISMRYMNLYTDTLGSHSFGGRLGGGSARCILKKVTVTFKTENGASRIILDGRSYSNNQTADITPGTHTLEGSYDTKYTFASWDTEVGDISNADYVDYYANKYTIEQNDTITLTGQYVPTELQNLSADSCTSEPIPTYDNRDNQIYWVKRLDDGNCWMMDNLALGNKTITTDLTSANTNITSTIASSTFNNWEKSDSSSVEYYSRPKFIRPSYRVDSVSGTKYSMLYNYCAASGNSYCYSKDTTVDYGDAASDLCPAGWRMPTGGDSGEFAGLYNNDSYNTIDKMRAPVSEGGAAFAFSGYYPGGGTPGIYSPGSWGYYWSSTRHASNYMYEMYINESELSADSWSIRYMFNAVRCIAK